MAKQVRLTVPEQYYATFHALINMSAGDRERLLSALKSTKATLSWSSFAKNVSDASGIQSELSVSIISALYGLYHARWEEEEPNTLGISAAIIKNLKNTAAFNAQAEDGRWELFEEFLTELLNCDDTVGLTFRAADVFTSNENNCIAEGSRIITDIRPIYDSRHRVTNPSAVAILHTLQIMSGDRTGKTTTMFVCLDGEDLKHLQMIVGRAIEKEENLYTMMDQSGIKYLNADKEKTQNVD